MCIMHVTNLYTQLVHTHIPEVMNECAYAYGLHDTLWCVSVCVCVHVCVHVHGER